MAEIRLPLGGVSDQTAFRETPRGTVPPGAMDNMVLGDSMSGRRRLTKRPALVDIFGQAITSGGPVQGLGTIARASAVTSFELGEATELVEDNLSVKCAALADFNVALISMGDPTVRELFKIDGSGGAARVRRGSAPALQPTAIASGFPNSPTPSWYAIDPSGTLAVACINYSASSQARVFLVFFDVDTGDYVGAKDIAPSGEDTASPNNVSTLAFAWTARGLWVARGTQLWYVRTPVLAGKARLHDPATLSAVLASPDPAAPLNAASRIVGLATATVAGVVYLFGCFEGATGAGRTANPTGDITTGEYARHFRSGVYRWIEGVDIGSMTLSATLSPFTPAPTDFDPFVEVSGTTATQHLSVRFSQVLDRAPWGCLPLQIAADPSDGSFVVTFTNQGYGPTSSYLPNGSTAYTTVAKFTLEGLLMWEMDTESLIASEEGGCIDGSTAYRTDIPNLVADSGGAAAGATTRDGPCARALAIAPGGTVFVGTRISSGLHSLFCLGSSSGQILWRARVESNQASGGPTVVTPGQSGRGVPRGGVGVNGDGDCVAVFARNNTVDPDPAAMSGATQRPYANLGVFDAVDGEVLSTHSVTQDEAETDPTGIAVAGSVAVWGGAIKTDS